MKKLFYLGLLLALPVFSQPKKYQSLLWEISRNGLAKKSYIYGSMHVSDKVSYHLSDAFFKHLLASDFVATESDPATWIALYDSMDTDSGLDLLNDRPFYSKFEQKPVSRENLLPLFQNENNTVHSLLSRTSETQKDYQEDTYLDMFIYQTGRKYKKKVIGLEDAKVSMLSVMNAESPKEEPREENMQAIAKLLRERSFNQAMLDYYREKNLDMLDSLYTMITPPGYFKALILDRNEVMAKSIDSIARKGSLFAAVGAAHLPGKQGIIEILRGKGYTVKPIVDGYTDKGRTAKKNIDDFFIKPEFTVVTTSDGMVSLPMLPKQIFSSENIGTPDLANGGIINLKRLPLRNYLRKDDTFNPKSLDSLFFENIPGTILQKKLSQEDNYSVYDITSKTKTGNAQHYRFYITPLEIIGVSMSGNGNYVRNYENEIFPNIRIRKYTAGWEKVIPNKGGFSVYLPAYHTVYGNRLSPSPENVEINAYDSGEKAWYFLEEQTVNDNATLEETAFELKRIQDEFYSRTDARKTQNEVLFDNSYESEGTLGDKLLRLKTIIHGQKYYLLGAVNASEENARKYFNSFSLEPYRESASIKKLEDFEGHFSLDLPEKQNERFFWKKNPQDGRPGQKNLFKTDDKQYSFKAPSGETADVFAWTYHRYDYVRSKDTLLANIKRNILHDYNQEMDEGEIEETSPVLEEYAFNLRTAELPLSTWEEVLKPSRDKKRKERLAKIVNEKQSYNRQLQMDRLEMTAIRPGSQQAARYIAFVQDGYIWHIRSLIPKDQTEKSFADRLADSFQPITSSPERSLYTKKTDLFLGDAKSEEDSIRYSAFESVDLLQLDKSDLPLLKAFISDFEFKPEETRAISSLLERIGKIKDTQTIPFLENCYRKANTNAILQLSVIRALAKQESRSAYEKIAELLEYDLPLSDSESEIKGLFSLFANDIQNSKVLYPGILQYYGVSEYQQPIVEFTTQLLREDAVNPKKLKSYKKLLLADARLEAKRASVWKAKQQAYEFSENYTVSPPSESLNNYANLLNAFRRDKAVSDWFAKARNLNLPDVDFELLCLDLKNGQEPKPEALAALLENPTYRYKTYRVLSDSKKSEMDWKDDEVAKALALYVDPASENSILELLSEREISIGNKTASVFFFKSTLNARGTSLGIPAVKIVPVAFLKNQDKMDPRAWKALETIAVPDLSKTETEFDIIVDRLLNESHPRASFGKQEDFPNFYPESDY